MKNMAVASGNSDDRPGLGSKGAQHQSAVRIRRMALPGTKVRIIGRVVAVFAMVAAFGVLVVPQASAAGGSDYLRNWATGLCLDARQNGEVYTRTCDPNNMAQQWWLSIQHNPSGPDYATFTNRHFNGELGNALCGITTPKIFGCNPPWLGDGSSWQQVRLRHPITNSPAYCLDSNHAGRVYMEPCNDGGFQKWKYGY